MNSYQVLFTPTARKQALAVVDYISADSPDSAARWYAGLVSAVSSLDIMPNRCGRALESDYLGEELRQYIYGSYRIVFRVEEDAAIVRLLFIRHAARRALGES